MQIGAHDEGGQDKDNNPTLNDCRKHLRDAVAMRVRAEAEPKDEKSYHVVLTQAFGGDLDRGLRVVIHLAYHKRCKNKPYKFESSTHKANLRRGGPRHRQQKPSRSNAAGGDGVASPALADAPAPNNGGGCSSTRGASSSQDVAAPEPKGSSDGDGSLSHKADTSDKHTGILEALGMEPLFVNMPLACAHEKEQTRVVDLERQPTWEWVADYAKADDLMAKLRGDMYESNERIIAVDVEYRIDSVCVVQLATRQRTLVLDARKIFDDMRMLLNPILEHADICKVFHGDNRHISALKTNFDVVVQGPVFDTAKRAYFCDGEHEDGQLRSLRRLCQVYLRYDLPSLPRVQSWSVEMIRRAAMDAHVLLRLKDSIEY